MKIFKELGRVVSTLIAAVLIHVVAGYSQGTNYTNFMGAGAKEACQLTKGYMEPLVMGFSYGMSGAWFNTAKTHQLLGFDFSLASTFTAIPASQEYFVFRQSEYSNVSSSGDSPLLPTILSSSNGSGAELRFDYFDEESGQTFSSTYSPSGLGLEDNYGCNVVPVPILQLGIGTFINTDIIIRYTPELSYGNFKTRVFGLGIKHDIKQWIPSLREAPIDFAILGGFSGFENCMDLQEESLKGEGQETVFNVNNWNIQGIVSREFSIVTLYGAIGVSKVASLLTVTGTYVIEDVTNPQNSFSLTDPIQVTYKGNSYRATAGMKLHVGSFMLNADYTWQEYPVISLGLGFSIN